MSGSQSGNGLIGQLTRTTRSFSRDKSGAVAIIFGLVAITVVVLIGGAVDYGRWLNAKTQAVSALDSAVLAAGRVIQTNGNLSEARDAADKYYNKMKSHLTQSDSTSFNIIENGTKIQGTVTAKVATPFMGIVGVSDLEINLAAEAVLSSGGNSHTNIEITMMLDVTGSMGTTKLNDMKLAAKDLINIVVWQDQSQYTSKIALVPFSPAVNVGPFFEAVTGKNPAGSPGTPPSYNYPSNCYNKKGNVKKSCKNKPEYQTDPGTPATPAMATCVVDRTDSHKYTDKAPGPGAWIPTWNESNSSYAGQTSCTPSVTIMPLTNDKDALKSHIDSFWSSGMTAGALGTAWAWHMISPDWASIWPLASQPAPYSDLTRLNSRGEPVLRKIAILLTDGVYNQYAGSYSSGAVSTHAKQICTAMKAKGITVYTIGFAIGSSGTAYDTMRDCATTPSHFFNSSSGEELRQAFREIALQISTLRISK